MLTRAVRKWPGQPGLGGSAAGGGAAGSAITRRPPAENVRSTLRPQKGQSQPMSKFGKSAPMLAMYVAARDAAGEPVLVLEVVMPGDRHELEDAYQVG